MDICNCNLYLEPTENKYITNNNKISYTIYICADCNRCWIKRFFFLHEVEFNQEKQTWSETQQIKKLEDYIEILFHQRRRNYGKGI